MANILGIESTCDETACAIVCDGYNILSNIVSSQIDLHREFGGVVPELACRRHIDVIIPVMEQAVKDSGLSLQDLDAIAVAKGPGLIGALLIGMNAAKALSLGLSKPLIGINHVEAHLYSSIMSTDKNVEFPAIGVVISGGHTALVYIKNLGEYQLISTTVDDAIGEAFDKVASILSLPYPGGPEIEKLAQSGNSKTFLFKPGAVKKSPLDFSFSGLKTQVLYAAKGKNSTKHSPLIIEENEKKHLAASFQETALSDIANKTLLAIKNYPCRSVIFGGGVCNNRRLREKFQEIQLSIPLYWPSFSLSMDNAAMIAGLGFHYLKKSSKGDSLSFEASTKMPF